MIVPTFVKVVGGIIATVILGAVGSGIWERLLAPGIDWGFRAFVDLTTTYSQYYRNSIYKAAAQGFHEDYSHRAFVIIILLCALATLFFALAFHGKIRALQMRLLGPIRSWIEWLVVVLALAFALSALFSSAKHEAIQRTVTYSVQSMNILRPHIGEQKYHLLASEFYQIRTAEHFEAFNKQLIIQAAAFSQRLPEFDAF